MHTYRTDKMEEQDEDVELPIASVSPVGGDQVPLNGMLLHCRAKTQQRHTQPFTDCRRAEKMLRELLHCTADYTHTTSTRETGSQLETEKLPEQPFSYFILH